MAPKEEPTTEFDGVALGRVAEAVASAREVVEPFVHEDAQWTHDLLEGESLWSLQSAFLVSWLCRDSEPVTVPFAARVPDPARRPRAWEAD